MDNNPFFPNYWAYSQPHPRHQYYYYPPSPDPVHQYPRPVDVAPAVNVKPSASAPKVVRIPVHFISSEQPPRPSVPSLSKSESALRIQRVYRGFLVRKSLGKIKAIKKEVEDIEKRMLRRDYVELLKENEKERLKVNEMLMSLLFKLDSIRGFEFGVRECRKAVIKKAISLQERVDAFFSQNSDAVEGTGGANSDTPFQHKEQNLTEIHQSTQQEEDTAKGEEGNKENEGVEIQESEIKDDPDRVEVEDVVNEAEENGNRLDESEVVENEKVEESGELDEEKEGKAEKERKNNDEAEENGNRLDESEVVENEKVEESGELDEEKEGKAEKERKNHDEAEENGNRLDESEVVENEKVEESGELDEEKEGKAEKERKNNNNDNTNNRELLEKMMEENEKMMRMMSELYEKSEMQTRMLSSLTQRVEQLEKAFMCDRLRRKKKKHAA